MFDTFGYAVQAYERVRLYDPTGPLADDSLMALGNAYFRRGQWGDAAYNYDLLCKEYPNSKHQLKAHLFGLQANMRSYQGHGVRRDAAEGRRKIADTTLTPVRRQAGRRTGAGGPRRRRKSSRRRPTATSSAAEYYDGRQLLRRRPLVLQERGRRVPRHGEGQEGASATGEDPQRARRAARAASSRCSDANEEVSSTQNRNSRESTARRRCSVADRRRSVALRLLAVAGSLVVLLFFCGCAGYQIGNQSLYPLEIHTVYVPVFKSNSFRRNLGERLTEAVVKEIEAKTPYKVVSDPNADSMLTGRIVAGRRRRVLVPDLTGDAREVQVAMQRAGQLGRPQGPPCCATTSAFRCPPEIADVSGTGDLVPEVGQSVATAQQQAICRIAEQIVGLMEKPW